MSDQFQKEFNSNTALEDELEIKEPPMYKVLLHNDNYTPMEFVVAILINIFHKEYNQAEEIMLAVHNNGVGKCGIYTYEIAETKVTRVHSMAEKEGYPLKASLEPC